MYDTYLIGQQPSVYFYFCTIVLSIYPAIFAKQICFRANFGQMVNFVQMRRTKLTIYVQYSYFLIDCMWYHGQIKIHKIPWSFLKA